MVPAEDFGGRLGRADPYVRQDLSQKNPAHSADHGRIVKGSP